MPCVALPNRVLKGIFSGSNAVSRGGDIHPLTHYSEEELEKGRKEGAAAAAAELMSELSLQRTRQQRADRWMDGWMDHGMADTWTDMKWIRLRCARLINAAKKFRNDDDDRDRREKTSSRCHHARRHTIVRG